MKKSYPDFFPHTLPFLIFAGLTYILPYLIKTDLCIYSIKTAVTLFFIIFFFKDLWQEIEVKFDIISPLTGIIVFFIWVGLEGYYPLLGTDDEFTPYKFNEKHLIITAIFIRIAGAVIIVPIIEEFFWRSFALRYLIDKDFKNVPAGSFSWFSFILVSFAFGLEHFRWLPGIIAGVLYSLLYIQKKNIFSAIIAHSVTNLLLGFYVIYWGRWSFW